MPAYIVNTIKAIRAKNSNIGLQNIDTAGVNRGLSGNKGFEVFLDYRNIPVLSVYSSVKMDGVNWVILEEIDEEEAYRAIDELSVDIHSASFAVGIIALLLGALVRLAVSKLYW